MTSAGRGARATRRGVWSIAMLGRHSLERAPTRFIARLRALAGRPTRSAPDRLEESCESYCLPSPACREEPPGPIRSEPAVDIAGPLESAAGDRTGPSAAPRSTSRQRPRPSARQEQGAGLEPPDPFPAALGGPD